MFTEFKPSNEYIGFIWHAGRDTEFEVPCVGFAIRHHMDEDETKELTLVLAVQDQLVAAPCVHMVNAEYSYNGLKRITDSVSSFEDRL